MNVNSLSTVAPRLDASRPIQLAVRLDWEHNTALALLAHGDIDAAIAYFRRSLHTRIDRACHLQTLFARDLARTLDHPPAEIDPAQLTAWRAMKMHANAIEYQAACRRVMRGTA